MHPIYNSNGLMVDPKTPNEVKVKYESAYLKTLEEFNA